MADFECTASAADIAAAETQAVSNVGVDGTALDSQIAKDATEASATNAASVPSKATHVLNEIDKTGSAPPGFKGGAQFVNDGRGGGQVLAQTDAAGNPISYMEFDLNPYQPEAMDRPTTLVIITAHSSR